VPGRLLWRSDWLNIRQVCLVCLGLASPVFLFWGCKWKCSRLLKELLLEVVWRWLASVVQRGCRTHAVPLVQAQWARTLWSWSSPLSPSKGADREMEVIVNDCHVRRLLPFWRHNHVSLGSRLSASKNSCCFVL